MRRWPKRRFAAHECNGFLRQDLRTSRDMLISVVPGTVANNGRMVCSVASHNGGKTLCRGVKGTGEMTNRFLPCSEKARQAINLAGILHSLELRSWIKLGGGVGCVRWDTWGHLLSVCLSVTAKLNSGLQHCIQPGSFVCTYILTTS